MKKKNILFVCKYNRFRSRVAEAYFKKINNNKNIAVSSAGIIKGYLPLDKNQVEAANEFEISIKGVPKTIDMDTLKKQYRIIVVANDIPKVIFNHYWYKDKVSFWKIPDVKSGNKSNMEENKKIIKKIISKVKKLNEELK